MLVDAGTFQGYRIAFWYLLKDETAAARSQGRRPRLRGLQRRGLADRAGVVGYALNSWPRRADVNLIQWETLTRAM